MGAKDLTLNMLIGSESECRLGPGGEWQEKHPKPHKKGFKPRDPEWANIHLTSFLNCP